MAEVQIHSNKSKGAWRSLQRTRKTKGKPLGAPTREKLPRVKLQGLYFNPDIYFSASTNDGKSQLTLGKVER
jgi:hypothetical protein